MKKIQDVMDLVEEPLSQVRFVMDYIQLAFDAAVITCFSYPTIYLGNSIYTFPDSGSRDALCELIGQKTIDVSLIEDVDISVTFEKGKIIIPLDLQSRRFGDAAEFIA